MKCKFVSGIILKHSVEAFLWLQDEWQEIEIRLHLQISQLQNIEILFLYQFVLFLEVQILDTLVLVFEQRSSTVCWPRLQATSTCWNNQLCF